ncbi:MAG: histone deacetylase [Chloroflexaceae bacterium]|nr:histone deacetylase [Chloroflexaceae bacterium]
MFPLIYSDKFLQHDTNFFKQATGGYHPECSDRLIAIVKALKTAPWADQLDWQRPTPLAERDVMPWLQQVHDHRYIEQLQNMAAKGGGLLDWDTPVSPQSYDVALLAVNAWLDGVDRVLSTQGPAFVLARPPGHHATREQGMGFCLLSNGAIAAQYALAQPNIKRVAILDWDVHHGNGTEAIVQSHPQIVYCSLHQSPCYPGTGRSQDRGQFNNVLNLPMSPGSSFNEYQPAFEQKVVPFLSNFAPDLLIISAGYDGNHDDPLAEIALKPRDFGTFTEYCLEITPKILFGLEGGYDLNSLSQSVLATVESCLNFVN